MMAAGMPVAVPLTLGEYLWCMAVARLPAHQRHAARFHQEDDHG